MLGIDRSADGDTIRAAYRRRARAVHPDSAGGHGIDTGSSVVDPAAEMAALNEAYRVLRDPARRVMYDRSLAEGREPLRPSSGSTSSSASSAAHPYRSEPLAPARIPWRAMVAVALIGSAVVVVGAAFVDPGSPPGPDGILRPGSCVSIEANGDALEIACGGEDDRIVVELVAFDQRCPSGTLAHRDRQGLGMACVASVASGG